MKNSRRKTVRGGRQQKSGLVAGAVPGGGSFVSCRIHGIPFCVEKIVAVSGIFHLAGSLPHCSCVMVRKRAASMLFDSSRPEKKQWNRSRM